MKFKYLILDPFGKYDITKEILFSNLDVNFIYEAQTRLEHLNKKRTRSTISSINYYDLFISEDDCIKNLRIGVDKVLVPETFFKNARFLLYNFLIENLTKRITKHFSKLKIIKRKYKKRAKSKIRSK
ncbi:hypothetical protein P3W45_000893 [Vairimorpha bombi]|jgi:hypothetical protein